MSTIAMSEAPSIFLFDTLKSSKRLHQSGLNQASSEAIAEEIKYSIDSQLSNFVTKSDFKLSTAKLESRIDKLELQIIFKLGIMLFAFVGILAAIKFFE